MSDCDRGLISAISGFRNVSLRYESRFWYSGLFGTSVAERRLGKSGTVSLERVDVTSSVEDLIDDGGESSLFNDETVD